VSLSRPGGPPQAATSAAFGTPERAAIAGVVLVVSGVLPAFLAASLAPRIDRDFTFGASELGLAVGAFYAVCTVASSPCGHLVERIGPIAVVRASAATTALCALVAALLAQSAAALIVALLLGGVGNAAAAPVAGALVNHHVAAERTGVALGAIQAGAPLGALLAGLALPAVAIPAGWRWTYVVAGALALIAAAAAPATPAPEALAASRRRRGLTPVHALAITATLASAATMGLVSFLVLYGVDSGMSESAAGAVLAAMSVAAVLSRVAAGMAADRTGRDPERMVAAMLAASAAGYLVLLAGEPAAVVAGAVVVGSVGWAWPAALTLAAVRRAPDAPAWAVGVMMSGLFLGAIAGPLLVGLLVEGGSFVAAWLATATLAVLAAATMAVTGRIGARAHPSGSR
jgi:MFS family permease